MTVDEARFVAVRSTGAVPPASAELAQRKLAALLRHVGEPVLFARVMLAMAADPAVAEPASAWATVSVNGQLVRARATGVTMSAAVDELAERLRVRLGRVRLDQRPRQHKQQSMLHRQHRR
jgi:ribosome-associated translation inhibitor RaiA